MTRAAFLVVAAALLLGTSCESYELAWWTTQADELPQSAYDEGCEHDIDGCKEAHRRLGHAINRVAPATVVSEDILWEPFEVEDTWGSGWGVYAETRDLHVVVRCTNEVGRSPYAEIRVNYITVGGENRMARSWNWNVGGSFGSVTDVHAIGEELAPIASALTPGSTLLVTAYDTLGQLRTRAAFPIIEGVLKPLRDC